RPCRSSSSRWLRSPEGSASTSSPRATRGRRSRPPASWCTRRSGPASASSTSPTRGRMRVIAGHLGGRRLSAPRGLATRPTSDRVREALFSALGDVGGATVLDLYAGTGALGIEALSRGAAGATFVENARPALAALRGNLAALGLEEQARVIAQPVARSAAA